MNVFDITTPSKSAIPEDVGSKFEELWSQATELTHLLHFLMGELEDSLNPDRGHTDDRGTITLMFQKDGIEAKLWAMGNSWSRCKKLRNELEELFERFERQTDPREVANG